MQDELALERTSLSCKSEYETTWGPVDASSSEKPCRLTSPNFVSRLSLPFALMVMSLIRPVLPGTLCHTENPNLNTNITNNVGSLLCYNKYKMALGCPYIQEQRGYTLPNKVVISWLPCKVVPKQKLEECSRIKPLFISHYNSLMTSGEYEVGHNMGFAYVTLEREGKLRCFIEGASDWTSLNFERLLPFVKILGHNIHKLQSAASSHSNRLQLEEAQRQMEEHAQEVIESIEELGDRKKLSLILNNFSKGKDKLRDIVSLKDEMFNSYPNPLRMHLWDMKADGTVAFAKALQHRLIINELILHGIEDKGASAVGVALEKNTYVNELTFYDSRITSLGASALAKMLMINRSLVLFYLRTNAIIVEAMSDFSKALMQNTVLERLTLKSIRMGTEGAMKLAKGLAKNKSLIFLDLSDNQIGSEGVIALVKAFVENDKLEWLILNQNEIDEEGIIEVASLLLSKITRSKISLNSHLIQDRGALALFNLVKTNIYVTVDIPFFLSEKSLREELNEVMQWQNRTEPWLAPMVWPERF